MEEHLASLTKGERIELAVAACSRENGPSARKAAKVYDVAPSTITRRLNHSVQSATSVHQSRQRLSPTEEQVVIQKAIHYYESGLPLGIRHLHEFANEILTRKDPDAPEIGQNWHKKLLARNPLLERVLSRPPDRVRTTVVTRKNTLEGFFKLYSELRKTHGIALNDVYNMDEKGFLMGPIQPSHVLIPIQEKHAYLYQDEGREWISVSECISADGEALPAWVVFKAENQQNSWSNYLSTGNSEFATSENGWTDDELELNWLQEHFHPLTEKRRHGEFRMLIVDGHESHCKPEFIDFCVNNKIILLILPPNNTHLVRPLDVAVFQSLAKAFNVLLDDHNQFCGNSLTREYFTKYYQMARSEVVNRVSIMPGWRNTGLFPFNPQEVLHQQRGPLSNLPQTRPVSTTFYSDQP